MREVKKMHSEFCFLNSDYLNINNVSTNKA